MLVVKKRLPGAKPAKISLQTNKKQGFKKDFPQHFDDTTPPIRLNEIRKVRLFQDIFHVLVVSQSFCILVFQAIVSCGFLDCWYAARIKLESELLYVYMICDLNLRLFAYSSSLPKKEHKGVVDYSPDTTDWTHLTPTINLISTFCTQFQLFGLKYFIFSLWARWNFCMYIITKIMVQFCYLRLF